MNSCQLSRSLMLASLLALTPLAQAQPDQRQFTSDRPMEPFQPGESTASPAAEGGEAAAASTDTAASAAVGDGAETRSWLDLQASGSAAVGGPRPMPGEVADAVYQRYVNSFKQPIPASFSQSSGGSSSGQSGDSGGESSH